MTDENDISPQGRLILDSVAFELAALKHPVEALTIEAASKAAGVSASTVTSGVHGVEDFRQRVLLHLLSQFQGSPSPAVWNAVQSSIVDKHDLLRSIAVFLDAASLHLADDPALPFVIGTYDTTPEVLNQIEAAVSSFTRGFTPLLITVAAASGLDLRHQWQNRELRTALWMSACAAAVEPVLLQERCSTSWHRTTTHAAGLLSVLNTLDDAPVLPSSPAITRFSQRESTSLERAIQSGADLLLRGQLPPNADLTVAEICRRAGVGVSAFYRQFPTLGEFNRIAIGEAGRRAREVNVISFNQDLEEVAIFASDDWDVLVRNLVDLYIQASDYARIDRVETPLWPWLNTQPATRSLHEFLEMAVTHRIPAYQAVADLAGRELVPGCDDHNFAWVVSSIGTAGNMERNRFAEGSAQKDLATAVLSKLMSTAIRTMTRPKTSTTDRIR